MQLSCIVICSEQQKTLAADTARVLLSQGADHVVLVAPTETTIAGVDCIVSKPWFSGFSAGYNRDLGVAHTLSTYGASDFLFIDGDCIPSPGLVQHHKQVLAQHSKVICCGLRLNKSTTGQLRVDRRLGHPATRMRLFVNNIDRVLLNPKEVLSHSAAWSCNLSVTHASVLDIRNGNQITSEQCISGRLFHSIFDGVWGGEDTFLGAVGFRTGSSLIFLDPDRSHVIHVDHESNAQGNNNLRMCYSMDRCIRARLSHSCTISVLKNKDGTDPIPDTRDFYANIIKADCTHVNGLNFMMQRLNVTGTGERAALLSLFSRNPEINYVSTGHAQPVSPERVLELFNKARTEVFTLSDMGIST